MASYIINIAKKHELLIDLKKAIKQQVNSDKLIKIIDRNISSEDARKIFENHFNQAHGDFLKRLKSEYSELTPGDLKLCAYLWMNL